MTSQKSPDPERVRTGATCKAFREKSGLNVNDAGQALGISYSYLSNIEAGRKPLTEILLARMAELYRVPPVAIVRPDLFQVAA